MIAFFIIAIIQIERLGASEQCIEGKYHKSAPGPETGKYAECRPWMNKTCCTAAFTKEFAANRTKRLYGHDWHRCKKLSSSCERFWMNQECFYQCSPYIYKWKNYEGNPAEVVIKGLPICKSVCDRWYEACKSDEICVENVLADYNFTEHGENICPKDKPCITYEKMYGNGKNLCEKMWGSSYVYTKENSDSSNCMVMWFSGENPNKRVKIPRDSSNASKVAAYLSLSLLASLFTVLLSLILT